MSSRKHTSPYQPAELSENRKRPMSPFSIPITCSVCHKVFSDKVSFMFHFECHFIDRKIPLSWCFQSASHLSINSSPYSSTLKNMNKRLRPLSVSSADVGLVDVPILNSMPPLNPSLSHHRLTSPSMYPIVCSGTGRFAPRSSIPAPTLHLRWVNGEPGHPSGYKNPHMKQLENLDPEIIVISDDEDENKGDEIDLTLKL